MACTLKCFMCLLNFEHSALILNYLIISNYLNDQFNLNALKCFFTIYWLYFRDEIK